MAEIKITISNNSKDLGEENYLALFDLSANGLEIYPKHDDFPMPWDAVGYIEGDMFIMEGDLGQQGSHKGFAKVGIPLDKVMQYIGITLHVDNENIEEVNSMLSEYNWL